jgi:hypothetical protein
VLKALVWPVAVAQNGIRSRKLDYCRRMYHRWDAFWCQRNMPMNWRGVCKRKFVLRHCSIKYPGDRYWWHKMAIVDISQNGLFCATDITVNDNRTLPIKHNNFATFTICSKVCHRQYCSSFVNNMISVAQTRNSEVWLLAIWRVELFSSVVRPFRVALLANWNPSIVSMRCKVDHKPNPTIYGIFSPYFRDKSVIVGYRILLKSKSA